ncbi:MAG: error-prone DNA polymerase [Chloroflexi bacterium]|nr:error-prone DNA polymerase [Chloroflexota bacterium]
MALSSPYAELHAHSCWSLREGASATDEMVDRAVALGYPAMAITDHDNLYGAMEYARAARERGLRPITGCELSLSGEAGSERVRHVTVLAETVEGYRNLCGLLSRAYLAHGKDSPRTEREWLFEHRDGLVVLSGCREGVFSDLAPGEAERVAGEWRDALGGDHFFVELQHHDVYGDSERVAALAEVAERAGLQVVATNNAHYHVRERHRLNDVLVAVRHRLTLDSSHRERRPNSEFFLKRGEAMARRFARYPGAVSNTLAIAERCRFDLTRDLPYRLPDYPVPDGASPDSFLRGICERSFRRKYGPLEPSFREEARERLERELGLIAKHGLAGFFLVYWELLEMAGEVAQELHGRDRTLMPDERPVGRGRGSSVSSIVCYLIGLSHIDPVRNNLYLERFLNEELHSLPDIDLDFPRDIRDELLKRVYTRFGEEHAAIVAAFPTYRFRSAVVDIGKALGLPAPVLAKLNKLGDGFANADEVAEMMRLIPELRPLVNAPIWRDLVALAEQVAGFPRHIGQHVGGVVISADPLTSVVPVEPARMEGRYVCQWDKDSVDDARFVKIDFLALGMLSAVNECLDIIEEEQGVRVDLGRIPHDSPEIYASIQDGDTMGVFQIESRAQIQTLPRTRPANLDDLAVQVAIIRPGPIVAGAFRPYMEYRQRLARGEAVEVDYGHPELAPLLKDCMAETLGHVLYQDQVLQISCAVAGFTPGQADKLRRAMSRKRSVEAMQALAEEFYAGAARQGVSREAAEVAFEKMAAFAAFGFPKSHAVAFALLAYESAWLRYHYPTAFTCALFNAQPMGFYSVEVLTGDARRHGIEVLPPAINVSRARTWPERDDIRLGLSHVKGLGGSWADERGKSAEERREGTPKRIVAAREQGGPFRSLYDLVTRARLDRREAEALIRAGALDEFGLPRRELLWQLGVLTQGVGVDERRKGRPRNFQPGLPLPTHQDMAVLPPLPEWEKLAWDFEKLGLSGQHPMALVRPLLHEGLITARHLGGPGNPNRLPEGMMVEMAGMVVTRQRPSTASGIIFMLLEDEFGLANVVVYTQLQERQRELIRATPFVIVRGRVDNEQSGFPNIIAERFRPCPLPGFIDEPESHNFG